MPGYHAFVYTIVRNVNMSSLRLYFIALAHRAASHSFASCPQHNTTSLFDCDSLLNGDLDLDHLARHDNSGLLLDNFSSSFLSHL